VDRVSEGCIISRLKLAEHVLRSFVLKQMNEKKQSVWVLWMNSQTFIKRTYLEIDLRNYFPN
ncbi:hypothetical protein, partial [Aliikangiella sp. G2MR2-5]|uniref:hypothetical protein n=1 Tax=Aliikangiella sp. G2MR2-5 TaxID=2788943 RepID=UPI001AEE5AED